MRAATMKVPAIRVTPPGPKAKEIIKRDETYLANTTKTSPIVAKRALGSVIEDVDGNLIIDFTCGIGVVNMGYSHPRVVEAVKRQAGELMHFAGQDYYYDLQARLAQKLCEITPGNFPKKAFFANSGAEAVEAAMKVSRYYRPRGMYIAFLKAFHGRTMGALSLTASKAIHREKYHPLVPGVVHVPYANCYRCVYRQTYPECGLYCADIIKDLYMKTIAPPGDVAALFMEPVQGEGGYIVPPKGWTERIAKIAKDSGILLVDDEVQAGFGRTGKMFAVQHTRVVPDIITMAKAMGSGMPIAATVFDKRLDFPTKGAHSNTYGGNLVACAASLATIEAIEEEKALANCVKMGEHMRKRLEEMKGKYEIMGDNRGLGLMRATEFVEDRKTKKPAAKARDAIVKDAYEHGLLMLPCGESSIRYIPAINVSKEMLDAGLDVLEQSIKKASK